MNPYDMNRVEAICRSTDRKIYHAVITPFGNALQVQTDNGIMNFVSFRDFNRYTQYGLAPVDGSHFAEGAK